MRASLLLALAMIVVAACGKPATPPAAPAPTTVAPQPTNVVVRAQTEQEAFAYLWNQLGQMPFFRANGYDVALPQHPFFRHVAEAGRNDADEPEAQSLFAQEVYDDRAFKAGLRVFEDARAKLPPVLATFDTWTKAWGFEHRPRIDIVLTLYGPGGSYDPDASVITVLTTTEGKFRKPPLDNMVHEMVHLGIERPLVRRFNLSHPEKERLVDRICVVAFHDLFPDYRVQPMGPPDLDAKIDAAALADLPKVIAGYVAEHPR